TLRHSISEAMSRRVAVLGRRRMPSAACPSIRTLLSMIFGAVSPASVGQKKFSWARAALWNVRAETPPTPSARSRPRSSPAALAVKVTAITRDGEYAPVSTPCAMRGVITRVVAVPAQASTATGPRSTEAASRWCSSRASSALTSTRSARSLTVPVPLLDEPARDGCRAGQPDRALACQRRADLGARQPAHLDDLLAVGSGLLIDGHRLEAQHERARVRPRLGGDVVDVAHPHACLFEELSVHGVLEGLACLDEPGEAGEHPSSPVRVRAQQQPFAVRAHDRDDDGGIGAGEVLSAAVRAVP